MHWVFFPALPQALLDMLMELETESDTRGVYREKTRIENKAVFCHFIPLKSATMRGEKVS